MVRSVLALSVLMSALVLSALWSMEDPQPWIPVAEEPPVPAASKAAGPHAQLRSP